MFRIIIILDTGKVRLSITSSYCWVIFLKREIVG